MGSESKSNSSAFASEFDDPLFVHPSDTFGIKLVPQKLTGEENYWEWSHLMKTVLLARNKLGLVDGSYPKPDADSPLFGRWERCNAFVLSWIRSSLSKPLSIRFRFATSASEVWKELEENFNIVNSSRIYDIYCKICVLTQANSSVCAYFSQLKRLWSEYSSILFLMHPEWATCRELLEYQEYQLLMHFLMGLNQSYAAVRSQILLMSKLPSVNKAFAIVDGVEILQSFSANNADRLQGR